MAHPLVSSPAALLVQIKSSEVHARVFVSRDTLAETVFAAYPGYSSVLHDVFVTQAEAEERTWSVMEQFKRELACDGGLTRRVLDRLAHATLEAW